MREARSDKAEAKEYKGKVTIECIVKSDRHKKREAKDYSGNAVLQRLGVFTSVEKDPVRTFRNLMGEMSDENKEKYGALHQLVEAQGGDLGDKAAEKVLARYLYEIGKNITEDFFKICVIFVRLYRDCLNEYGWELARKHRAVTLKEKKKEFAKEPESADYIPDLSNDFINYFLPQEFSTFDKYLGTELVRHLCDWVFKSGYTKKTLMLL